MNHHKIWVLILTDLSKSLTSLGLSLLIYKMGAVMITLLSTSQSIAVSTVAQINMKNVFPELQNSIQVLLFVKYGILALE